MVPLLRHVTVVPTGTFVRYGLNWYSSVMKRAPVNALSRCSAAVSICLVSLTCPVKGSGPRGDGGAGRAGNAPPSLNAQTFVLVTSDTNCSPSSSNEAAGPPGGRARLKLPDDLPSLGVVRVEVSVGRRVKQQAPSHRQHAA